MENEQKHLTNSQFKRYLKAQTTNDYEMSNSSYIEDGELSEKFLFLIKYYEDNNAVQKLIIINNILNAYCTVSYTPNIPCGTSASFSLPEDVKTTITDLYDKLTPKKPEVSKADLDTLEKE